MTPLAKPTWKTNHVRGRPYQMGDLSSFSMRSQLRAHTVQVVCGFKHVDENAHLFRRPLIEILENADQLTTNEPFRADFSHGDDSAR